MSKKISAVLLLISFITTNHFGMPALAATIPPSINNKQLPELSGVQVPKEIGRIEEIYRGKGNQTVILIQDAHAIPDAQRNIRKLIEHFQKEYGVSLVGLEGASAALDPQIFRSFPDKKTLNKVFEEYFDKGEVTGPTAAAILGNGSGVYHGVEDWDLYEKGLTLYRAAMEKQPGINKELEVRSLKLEEEKKKIYSKELLKIAHELQAFRENHQDLTEVLKLLAKVKRPEPGSELAALLEESEAAGANQTPVEIEVKKIAEQVAASLQNRKKLEVGSSKLEEIEMQEQTLRSLPTSNIELRTRFSDDIKKSFNQKYQEFQTSRITPQGFALFLKELTEKTPLSLQVSKELSRLMKNQKRMRDIEGTTFFDAFERYANSIKQILFKSDEEKALDQKEHRLAILEKMVRLELSRKDWEKIKQNVDRGAWYVARDAKAAAISSSIVIAGTDADASIPQSGGKETAVIAGTDADASIPQSGGKETAVIAGEAKQSQQAFDFLPTSNFELSTLLKNHMAFYENAGERDEALFNRFMALMQKYQAPSAILVAGGFHTQGFTQRLKKRNISYVLLRPQINVIPEATNYRGQMNGEVSWKNYFEAENGRINLYKAFVRGTRDRLLGKKQGLSPLSSGTVPVTLKDWRDQIIRDLSGSGKITEAGKYTKFIDEAAQKGQKQDALTQQSKRIQKFIKGLRELEAKGQMTGQNILKLIPPAAISTLVAGVDDPTVSLPEFSTAGTYKKALANLDVKGGPPQKRSEVRTFQIDSVRDLIDAAKLGAGRFSNPTDKFTHIESVETAAIKAGVLLEAQDDPRSIGLVENMLHQFAGEDINRQNTLVIVEDLERIRQQPVVPFPKQAAPLLIAIAERLGIEVVDTFSNRAQWRLAERVIETGGKERPSLNRTEILGLSILHDSLQRPVLRNDIAGAVEGLFPAWKDHVSIEGFYRNIMQALNEDNAVKFLSQILRAEKINPRALPKYRWSQIEGIISKAVPQGMTRAQVLGGLLVMQGAFLAQGHEFLNFPEPMLNAFDRGWNKGVTFEKLHAAMSKAVKLWREDRQEAVRKSNQIMDLTQRVQDEMSAEALSTILRARPGIKYVLGVTGYNHHGGIIPVLQKYTRSEMRTDFAYDGALAKFHQAMQENGLADQIFYAGGTARYLASQGKFPSQDIDLYLTLPPAKIKKAKALAEWLTLYDFGYADPALRHVEGTHVDLIEKVLPVVKKWSEEQILKGANGLPGLDQLLKNQNAQPQAGNYEMAIQNLKKENLAKIAGALGGEFSAIANDYVKQAYLKTLIGADVRKKLRAIEKALGQPLEKSDPWHDQKKDHINAVMDEKRVDFMGVVDEKGNVLVAPHWLQLRTGALFSIDALMVGPKGHLYDPSGGYADLTNGVVRLAGEKNPAVPQLINAGLPFRGLRFLHLLKGTMTPETKTILYQFFRGIGGNAQSEDLAHHFALWERLAPLLAQWEEAVKKGDVQAQKNTGSKILELYFETTQHEGAYVLTAGGKLIAGLKLDSDSVEEVVKNTKRTFPKGTAAFTLTPRDAEYMFRYQQGAHGTLARLLRVSGNDPAKENEIFEAKSRFIFEPFGFRAGWVKAIRDQELAKIDFTQPKQSVFIGIQSGLSSELHALFLSAVIPPYANIHAIIRDLKELGAMPWLDLNEVDLEKMAAGIARIRTRRNFKTLDQSALGQGGSEKLVSQLVSKFPGQTNPKTYEDYLNGIVPEGTDTGALVTEAINRSIQQNPGQNAMMQLMLQKKSRSEMRRNIYEVGPKEILQALYESRLQTDPNSYKGDKKKNSLRQKLGWFSTNLHKKIGNRKFKDAVDFLTFLSGELKDEKWALNFATRFELGEVKKPAVKVPPQAAVPQVPAGPALPEAVLRERWLSELKELSAAFNRMVKGIRENPVKQAEDQKHFDQHLRSEIVQAIGMAPSGKPAVILGAGDLREIPDEFFTSPKFPQLILVDLDAGIMRQKLRERGLENQIRSETNPSGRIQLIEADLSMLSPQMLQAIVHIAENAKNAGEAGSQLTQLYRTSAETAAQIQLPPSILPSSFDLVVSSTLFPTLSAFVQLSIERQIARRLGLPLPVDLNDSLYARSISYQQAYYPVFNQLAETHAHVLSDIVSPDGVIYLAVHTGRVHQQRLSRAGISNDQLEESLRPMARVLGALQPEVEPSKFHLFQNLINLFNQDPHQAPVQLTLPPEFLINTPDSFWIQGVRTLGTNVWVWMDRVDLGMGQLVQSLTLRRFETPQSFKKITMGSELTPQDKNFVAMALNIINRLRPELLPKIDIELGIGKMTFQELKGLWEKRSMDTSVFGPEYSSEGGLILMLNSKKIDNSMAYLIMDPQVFANPAFVITLLAHELVGHNQFPVLEKQKTQREQARQVGAANKVGSSLGDEKDSYLATAQFLRELLADPKLDFRNREPDIAQKLEQIYIPMEEERSRHWDEQMKKRTGKPTEAAKPAEAVKETHKMAPLAGEQPLDAVQMRAALDHLLKDLKDQDVAAAIEKELLTMQKQFTMRELELAVRHGSDLLLKVKEAKVAAEEGKSEKRAGTGNEQFKAYFDHYADQIKELVGDNTWFAQGLSQLLPPPEKTAGFKWWYYMQTLLSDIKAGREQIISLARQLGKEALNDPPIVARDSYLNLMPVFVKRFHRLGGSVLALHDVMREESDSGFYPFLNYFNLYFIYYMAAYKILGGAIPSFGLSESFQPQTPADIEELAGLDKALVQAFPPPSKTMTIQELWLENLAESIGTLRQLYQKFPELNKTIGRVYEDLLQQWSRLRLRKTDYQKGITPEFEMALRDFFSLLSSAMFVGSDSDVRWHDSTGVPNPQAVFQAQKKVLEDSKTLLNALYPGLDIYQYFVLNPDGQPRSEMRETGKWAEQVDWAAVFERRLAKELIRESIDIGELTTFLKNIIGARHFEDIKEFTRFLREKKIRGIGLKARPKWLAEDVFESLRQQQEKPKGGQRIETGWSYGIHSSLEVFGQNLDHQLTPSDPAGPKKGYGRPFIKETIESGLRLLPEFLLKDLLDEQKGAVISYAFYTVSTGVAVLPSSLTYHMHEAWKGAQSFAVLEMQAYDYPASVKMGRESRLRKESLYLPSAIYKAGMAHDISWSPQTKIKVEAFKTEDAKISAALDALDFKTLSQESVLHEIGGFLWYLLPEEMKTNWKAIYPFESPAEMSGIYLRNLLYSKEDPEKFMEETFSDKFAAFLLADSTPVLAQVGRTIRPIEREYFQKVLKFFEDKVKRGLRVSQIEIPLTRSELRKSPKTAVFQTGEKEAVLLQIAVSETAGLPLSQNLADQFADFVNRKELRIDQLAEAIAQISEGLKDFDALRPFLMPILKQSKIEAKNFIKDRITELKEAGLTVGLDVSNLGQGNVSEDRVVRIIRSYLDILREAGFDVKNPGNAFILSGKKGVRNIITEPLRTAQMNFTSKSSQDIRKPDGQIYFPMMQLNGAPYSGSEFIRGIQLLLEGEFGAEAEELGMLLQAAEVLSTATAKNEEQIQKSFAALLNAVSIFRPYGEVTQSMLRSSGQLSVINVSAIHTLLVALAIDAKARSEIRRAA